METVREPYEFLVRWIPAGVKENQYAGTVQAQVSFAYVARDGEEVIFWSPDQKGPFHVAISGDDGVPLDKIFPSLNTATLEALAAARVQIASLVKEIEELRRPEDAPPPE